jgi:ATP-dependent protease ClpP protease subunit
MSVQRFVLLGEAVALARSRNLTDRRRALYLARAANYGGTGWETLQRSETETVIFVFGSIHDENLLDAVREATGRLVVQIDCPAGGESGLALRIGRELLKRDSLGVVTGACTSAANWILAGCRRRVARPNAEFRVHAIKAATCGTAPELRTAASDLETSLTEFVAFFSERTGQPHDQVAQWFTGPDAVFTASEAQALGFVDCIAEAIADDPVKPEFERLSVDHSALADELARSLISLNAPKSSRLFSDVVAWLSEPCPPAGVASGGHLL